MASKKRARDSHKNKQSQPKNEQNSAFGKIEKQTESDKITDNLLGSGSHLSIQIQGDRLSDSRIPPAQRHRMALQINRTGGNQHLQRVLLQMTGSKKPGVGDQAQRHHSTARADEESSIQAKPLEGQIQRHTSTELEYEENSIQAKYLAYPLIQRNVRNLVDQLNDAMEGWGTDEQAITNAINNASAAEKREALRDPRLIARLRDELSRSEALTALTNLGATLSLRLEVAMDGLGAESGEIITMIENLPAGQAAEKEAVLHNPTLMARLRDELNREDALRAMAGLGSPLSERLRAAMDGWGVDEAAIESMISEADAAEKQAALRDRALIDRLKDEISQEKLYDILRELGVSLVDRLNAAMDGWGVDSAAILEMSNQATEAEKAQVLGDATTIARLSDELSQPEALSVMATLGVSLADRLHVAMNGWGEDSQAILAMIPDASEDERMAVIADTGTMTRLESELSEEEFQQARRLLRFGREHETLGASFTEEDLDNEELPVNLTANLSTELDSGTVDINKVLSDIAAASEVDREMVRGNHSLLRRLAEAIDEAEMRQVMELLGGTIVDRLNLLLTQEASSADLLSLVDNISDDDKQLVLNNRPALDRTLAYLEAPDDQTFLTALNDSLVNQLDHAIDDSQNITAVCALITAAPEAERANVEASTGLMTRLSETFSPLDYWKVRLHLAYGEPANYPAGLSDLFTAWESEASFDNIRRTFANLSDTEYNGIKEVNGIREVLRALISDDDQYMRILRMLDQGFISEETGINEAYQETLLIDADPTPALNFQPRNFAGTRGFDVAYYRDKLQVDVRIALEAQDDQAETDLPVLTTRWENMIENAWDRAYSVRNANHTLPISVNCHFTTTNPHHTVNVRSNPNPTWPAYNVSNWYYAAANYSQFAPVHEFGHMLGNPDEYNLSQAAYQATVGQNPATDPQATASAADPSGTQHFTNPSVMGANTPAGGGPGPGAVESRHLNYFVNWVNRNRRRNADGTFSEPAFTIV